MTNHTLKPVEPEYGRNEAFSNRRSSYTFDLPLAGGKTK
jgi:hypothetical protein